MYSKFCFGKYFFEKMETFVYIYIYIFIYIYIYIYIIYSIVYMYKSIGSTAASLPGPGTWQASIYGSHCSLSSNRRQFEPFLDDMLSPQVQYSHPVKNTKFFLKVLTYLDHICGQSLVFLVFQS